MNHAHLFPIIFAAIATIGCVNESTEPTEPVGFAMQASGMPSQPSPGQLVRYFDPTIGDPFESVIVSIADPVTWTVDLLVWGGTDGGDAYDVTNVAPLGVTITFGGFPNGLAATGPDTTTPRWFWWPNVEGNH